MRSRGVSIWFLITVILVLIYMIVVLAPERQLSWPFSRSAASTIYQREFERWNECMLNNLTEFRNDPMMVWKNVGKAVRTCETEKMRQLLKMRSFSNSDETKWHIMPIFDLPTTVVTLGIGHDTRAEEKLRNVSDVHEFFGADPMHEINEELYTKIPGKYFPFAVGAASGLGTASVLKGSTYRDMTVVYVEVIYFLKEIIKKTFIDDFWIDAEGAEYDMFPYFYNGGKFDENGITICQFNIEADPGETPAVVRREF
ncbi:unnamed protein product [Caenorhabditis bovis]|uniref:Methyltransferase FkbM domain-containing protein n=1 Tax=Caenorhabditis bovis TaxID=2654633 RepID=A0A8S1F488_9PELO|nr:unnamed protein product [Caenorhabditis bovis]